MQCIGRALPGSDDEEGVLLLQPPELQPLQGPPPAQRTRGTAWDLIRDQGLGSYAQLCWGSISKVWPTYLGSAMEFYEMGAYLQAGAALQANFFERPGREGTTAALGVWVGHSCTFLIRPLGGLLFGWVGDRFGRRVSMLITLTGMSVATALIGAIPVTPAAPYLLLLLKVIQGLFVSGEGAAALVYSIERSHPETKCLAGTSLFVTAVYAGTLLATLVTLAVEWSLTEAQYLAWGWRLPFLAALPMGAGFLMLRHHLPESEAFVLIKARRCRGDSRMDTTRGPADLDQCHSEQAPDKAHETRGSSSSSTVCPAEGAESKASNAAALPQKSSLRRELVVVLGMLCICANPAGAYGGLLYFPTFLSRTAGIYSIRAATSLSVAGAMIGMVAAPACGTLGDLLGAETMVATGAALVGALAWPLWVMAVSGLGAAFVSTALWAAVLAVQSGVYATFLADLFPTETRATGIGASYNMAFALFGGLCPILETLVWEANKATEVPSWRANSRPALILVIVSTVNAAACATLKRLRANGLIGHHLLDFEVPTRPCFSDDVLLDSTVMDCTSNHVAGMSRMSPSDLVGGDEGKGPTAVI